MHFPHVETIGQVDAGLRAASLDSHRSRPRPEAAVHLRFTTAMGGFAALLLASCSALKPVPETTRYYTLVSPALVAKQPAPDSGTGRVGVRVTAQTDYLRRPPIAVRIGENELRFVEDHRWGERVDEGTERALTLALQSKLKDVLVLPVSHGSASGATVIIDVVMAACEGTNDGATLECYWRLNAGTEIAPAASGHFRQTRTGWNGTDYGQLAGMLGALVDELAAEIAPAILR
jgi:uncharacterized lipoprotein YmbA